MKVSKRKKNERKQYAFRLFRPCPNCGENIAFGGHYAPPSMGEAGFFICQPARAGSADTPQ